MAVVLGFLIVAATRKREGYLLLALTFHVINMIVPQIYRPIAIVWLGLSDLMGEVASKVMLSIVFFLVVTPIGLIRRMFGKDSMRLRDFKASTDSVMLERNHLFVSRDIESPY